MASIDQHWFGEPRLDWPRRQRVGDPNVAADRRHAEIAFWVSLCKRPERR